MKKSLLRSALGVGVLIMVLNAKAQQSFVDDTVENFKCTSQQNQLLTIANLGFEHESNQAEVKLIQDSKSIETYRSHYTIDQSSLYTTYTYELFS